MVKTFLVFRGVSERWAGVAFNGGVIDLNAKFASVARKLEEAGRAREQKKGSGICRDIAGYSGI